MQTDIYKGAPPHPSDVNDSTEATDIVVKKESTVEATGTSKDMSSEEEKVQEVSNPEQNTEIEYPTAPKLALLTIGLALVIFVVICYNPFILYFLANNKDLYRSL